MNIWIELSTVVVEVFLAWFFFSGMLGRAKSSKLTRTVIAAAYFVALAALSLFMPVSPLRSVIIMLVTYLSAKIYFNNKWLATVYPTILFFLFAILADILCGTLLQLGGVSADAIMGNGVERLIYIILSKLLHLLCLYIIITITRPNFDLISFIKSLPLLSCQILSIYICQRNFIIVLDGNGPAFLQFETLGLLYINLIMCAFVEILNRAHERERKAELERQRLELQKDYYHDVLERQEETRRLWHDIKKYVASVESLVCSENREEARKCLEDIQSAFAGVDTAVDTGNSLIDSILSYGIKKAEEVGVKISPDIWVGSELNFPPTDLFVIIGNTLDNAIEACCLVEDKAARVVSVSLRQKNHILLYEIRNPYTGIKIQKPGNIHGYGLKNAEACVAHSDGRMTITDKNNVFVVSIQLNLGE